MDMDYNNNRISMDDKIIHMMLHSIRDKVNCLQAELEINGLDEITKNKIINVYKILCNE